MKIFLHRMCVLTTGLFLLSGFNLQRVSAQESDLKLPPRIIEFEHLTTEDGLSNPVVMGIVQDPRGFMWFSTTNGLSRYDGYSFVNYTSNPDNPEDPWSVGAAVVTNLLIDSTGLFWIATYGGGVDRYDFETGRFIHYRHNPEDTGSISHNVVQMMSEDSRGNIWFATIGGGLNRYDGETDKFYQYKHDPDDPYSIGSDKTYNVYEDSLGDLWVAVAHGIDKFDRDTERFIHYRHDPEDPRSITNSLRWTILEDHLGTLWFNGMDGGGLLRFNREEDNFIRYTYDPEDPYSISTNSLRNSFEDSRGTLWVATMGGGVNVYDRKNDNFIRYKHDPDKPGSIIYDDIIKIYEDRSGVLWFSTFGGGISKYDRKKERFRYLRHDPADPQSLSNDNINGIFQDSRGDIWIGTTDGLNKYVPETDLCTRFRYKGGLSNSLNDNNVRRITEDTDGFFWITTAGQGVNRYDPRTDTFTYYKNEPDNTNSLSENVCYGILFDDEYKELWIGHQSSVSRFSIENDKFQRYETTSFIEAIHRDRKGILWFGGGLGLFRYDREQNKLLQVLNKPSPAIGEDISGNLWIGTVNGLGKLNRETGELKRYTMADGLIDDNITGILNDGVYGLWISTSKGLSHFNTENGTIRNYPIAQFNRGGAYYKCMNGEIFFGGPRGIVRFFHHDIIDNPYIPSVVLTAFRKFNKEVTLDTPISNLEQLDLTYKDSVISFEFSALDYSDPFRNRYKYKLEGFDLDWTEVGSDRRFVTYTNLDGGEYVFRVIGSNNDGVWNEDGLSMKIDIQPPYWVTLWFRGAVTLVGICIIAAVFVLRSRAMKNQRMRLEQQVSDRTRELHNSNVQLAMAKEAAEGARRSAEIANNAKSSFLSSMSHELRTPLNGILGYAQILKEGGGLNASQTDGLDIIYRSGQHLLSLITDILDIARIEAGRMELYTKDFDLPDFLRDIENIIGIRAKRKNLEFTCNIIQPIPSGIQADETRLRQILLNLLGNAVKFTDTGSVTLNVRVQGEKIQFEVIDTGIGISRAQLANIFLPFRQEGDAGQRLQGTGLGLAISRYLVKAMGSEIFVHSTPGEGSTFSFELSVPMFDIDVTKINKRKILGYKGNKRKILIADDNRQNQSVLTDMLEPIGFEVVTADNGQEEVQMVREHDPDLILTDIIMPIMTGLEAVEEIRQIPRMENVPIIAVSASVFEMDQKKSLAAGCNGFIPKPVDADTLIEMLRRHLGLEWLYEEKDGTDMETDSFVYSMTPLPVADINALSDLVRQGNMNGIYDLAGEIADTNPIYKPFTDYIRMLARDFQDKTILHLLEKLKENME